MLAVLFPVHAINAAERTVNLAGLPDSLARQIRSVLAKADTLAEAPGFVLMGPDASGSSASDTPRIPMLNAPQKAEVSGGKPIVVAWVGGSGAYQVQLLSSSGAVVSTQAVSATQAVFQGGVAPPGTYGVRVVDSKGLVATGSVSVVQNGPALDPDEIDAYRQHMSVPDFTICEAVAFATQHFYLQAYQLLLSVSDDYAQAVRLRHALVQGVSIP